MTRNGLSEPDRPRFDPLPDPETGTWLCPCTVLYPDQLSAVACARRHQKGAPRPRLAPLIPGDPLMKSRPVYSDARPVAPAAAANPIWTSMRRAGALIALCAAAWLLALFVFGDIGDPSPRPPAAATPAPIPNPCQAGGVKCYWGTK